MKSKYLIITLLYIMIPGLVLAQDFLVKGNVIDKSNNSPLSYATVQITNENYNTGAITNIDGQFTITVNKNGTYTISVSCIGYKEYTDTLNIQKALELEPIYMEEDPQMLEDVVVVGAKSLVKREVDRIVFDAQAIATGSLNLYDLLSSTPGVLATNDDISIVGKGSVQVLINDRESRLSGKELIATLKSYNSEDIDKIEVITTPPSKYDAEGNAGIINIRLKQRIGDYLGGNISDMQQFSNYNLNEYSAALNYNKGKVAANFNVSGGLGKHGYEKSYTRYYPNYRWESKNEQVNDNLYVAPRLGVDIELPKNYSIGMIANYLHMEPDFNDINESVSINTNTPFQKIKGISNNDIKTNQYDINFHIEKKLDSLGKKITLDADLLGYGSKVKAMYASDSWFNYENIQSHNVNNYSTRLDAYLPYKKIILNAGAKYSYTNTHIKLDYIQNSSDNYSNDNFRYIEHIAAIYGDANFTLSSKFQLKMGLRFEYTKTNGESYITKETNDKDYWGVFPTLYLGYNPSEKHAHSLTLARRLNRPSYSSVNPIVRYENEYTYFTGNPYLNPAYFYTASYGYTYNNNLSFELTYQFSDDVFGQKMIMDPQTQITTYKWMNFKKNHVLLFGNSYFFNKWSWLQSYIQHGLYWTKSVADHDNENYFKDGWSYYISLYNTFYFNKAKTFTGNLAFNYQTKTYTANEIEQPMYNIDAGLQYSFFKNKLIVGFNVNNILASRNKGTTYDNNLYTDFNNMYNYRSYRISLTWRFGGYFETKRHSTSNSEEKGRL